MQEFFAGFFNMARQGIFLPFGSSYLRKKLIGFYCDFFSIDVSLDMEVPVKISK